MAAVLSPSYGPRQGILLNRSPSVSPYQHSSALPLLVPSNISLSSSASSTSNPNTDSEYFLSSASNSKETSPAPDGFRRNGALTPNTQHLQKPRSGSSPAMRKIRFAPLPDPRRELISDPGLSLFPAVFLDDTDEPTADVALTREDGKLHVQDASQYQRSPGSLLFAGSALFRSSSPSGSAQPRLLPSESTATLASTITAHSAPPTPSLSYLHLAGSSTRIDHDWTVLPADARPHPAEITAEAPRRSGSGSKWSRKLFKPLLGPLAKGPCADGDARGGKSTSSRERESEWVREFGAPLHRWTSEGEVWGAGWGPPRRKDKDKDKDKDKKGVPLGRSQSLTEEGRGRKRSGSADPSPLAGNGRKQQRMLNGRVYGAKRNQNPFANVRSEEPEFVEWGYGGMGSVQTSGVGASVWAKVQSSGGMKVGAHEGAHARGDAHAAADENVSARRVARSEDGDDGDGSGMSWVKRRREERERREREEQEKREREEKAADVSPAEPQAPVRAVPAPAPDVPAPSPAALAIAAAVFTSSPLATPVESPSAHAEGAHVYQAVTVPAPAPHHHHSHSHSHSIPHRTYSHGRTSIERAPSVQMPRPERTSSIDTARGVPGVLSPSVVDECAEAQLEKESQVDEPRSRRESVSSESTESGEGASGSPREDGFVKDGAKEGGEEGDDDEEDEAELERNRLALGAGVEKISRHKELADAGAS